LSVVFLDEGVQFPSCDASHGLCEGSFNKMMNSGIKFRTDGGMVLV